MIILLGPSHHVYLDGCAVTRFKYYSTPIGKIRVDTDTCKELVESGQFTYMNSKTDEQEHSLEMHLPYIRKTMSDQGKSIPLVPILVGSINPASEKKYGAVLRGLLSNKRNAVIISSDFCHWGSRFSHMYYEDVANKSFNLSSRRPHDVDLSVRPIHESIEAVDRRGMKLIEQGSHDRFVAYLAQTGNTICGRHPISVVLAAMEGSEGSQNFSFIKYAQSSRIMTNLSDSSVSYASAHYL